jgi:hypothetical protein
VSSSYRLPPWTQLVRPHNDVAAGVLDMGSYAASLAGVFRHRPGIAPVYRDAGKFFQATYLTDKMAGLLSDTMDVLAGRAGSHVLQLRTPFGGGKTHSLVALLHLVRDREASLASCASLRDLSDPGPVQVAVLSGEELDPLSPMTATGTRTHTLWGELGAQLGCFHLVAEHDRTGAAPGGEVLRQMLAGRPTLILLDEVLVYVEKAMAVQRAESTAGRQAMLFVQALTEAISSQPNAAMVYSLQASVGEAVGSEGLLSDLDKLVTRVDAKREPVADDEVLRVVQRRLFAELGDPDMHHQVAAAYAQLLRRQLLASAETGETRREAEVAANTLEQRVIAAYPFHPDLLDLMYHRWGSLVSYQRTRGALQFLAAAVHALWTSGADSPLIGPGDIDFTDEATRSAFFSQVGERERYTSVVSSDITARRSGAATVDRRLGADSSLIEQLKVGTRVARAIMLYSFGAREGEDRGVLETDLVRSVLVPGLDRNVVISALHDLREEALYLHNTGRRYRFEPTPNLTKLVKDEADKLEGTEVLAGVRTELELQLRGSIGVALWPDSPAGIPDEQPRFTVAYLHPDWSEERKPPATFIEQASRGNPRRYRNGLALVVPDKAQFDSARHAMRTRAAADSLLRKADRYGFTVEQVEELKDKASSARGDCAAALNVAYSTVIIPTKARSGDNPYQLERIDLRTTLVAGRALHERVVEALSQRVFSSLTTSKLIALAGLGPDRRAVLCSDLVDWFYSFFEFTKLWDKKAIAATIARAISEAKLGYVVGLVSHSDQLAPRDKRQVRFNDRVTYDEIDLSSDAALLWEPYARECVEAPSDTDPVSPDVPTAPSFIANPLVAPKPEEDTAAPRQRETGETGNGTSRDIIRRADITAVIARPELFNLGRALSWLREQSGDVRVEIRIVAEGEFNAVECRKGLVEPLEEATAEITIVLR